MNSPTWALVTEAKKLLVLVSNDLALIKNIQLCASKFILLTLVPWPDEEVKFEPEAIDTRNKLLFIKSVLVNQKVYRQRILDEYEPVNQHDIQLLEITQDFFNKVMPNNRFINETMSLEIEDLHKYKKTLEAYDQFIYRVLFDLDYSLTVPELTASFKRAITDIGAWPDATDRFFIFGKVTRMYMEDYK